MSWYRSYKLVEDGEGYNVVIYLNQDTPEFAGELLEGIKENILTLDEEIKKLVNENFANVKVNSVKLMLGAMLVGSMPFIGHTTIHAAEPTSTQVQQVAYNTYASQPALTGEVSATKLNVRQGPGTSYSIIHRLWSGNVVKVIDESNGWYKILLSDGRTGWVSGNYLKLQAPINNRQQKIDTVIGTAQSLIGTPYVWGGRSPQDGGFDCSGFTQYVYKQVGVDLNRISRDQATQGFYVARADLEPGDLVYFSLAGDGTISHVGIYIGNGKMIHSPKTGDSVKVTDINTTFWQTHYMTARRVL